MVERYTEPGEVRDWRTRAACRDVDAELFFPVAEAGSEREQAESAAKRVCVDCPVRAECLAWAVRSLPFGVAGGHTETERAELRRGGRPAGPRRTAPVVVPGPSCRGGRAGSRTRPQGYAALARGGGDRERVAQECGVSRRTVDRWAAALRDGAVLTGGAR